MTKLLQERATAYADLLQNDVNRIMILIEHVRELASTNDTDRVHELLLKLDHGYLANDWVKVPRQYTTADFYLIAMDRFLSFAQVAYYDILTPDDREELTLLLTEIDLPAAFQFQVNTDSNGGAYFVEVNTNKRLFYWSPERRQLLFNSDDITDLLVANYRKRTTAKRIRTLTTLLSTFAHYLEATFGYQVDYNILETTDSFLYPLVQNEMPAGMLDRLFVLSAESNFFLQRIPNGAGMMLDNQVEVRIFYVSDLAAPATQRWHFQVIDGHDAVSWLDVLLAYDFIGAWYLIERSVLAIASDDLVFKLQAQTNRIDKKVTVEVLTPRGELA